MRPDRLSKTSALLLLGVFAFTTSGLRMKAVGCVHPSAKLMVVEQLGSILEFEPFENLEMGADKRWDRPTQNKKASFVDCISTLLYLEKGSALRQCLNFDSERVVSDKVPLIIRQRSFLI